jgi:hypothetical protein
LKRVLPKVLALGLAAAALWPAVQARRAARDAGARVRALAAGRGAATILDPALSLRVQRLGPWLASWETVGGCGAGGATVGSGVKWIGHNTTGGLFQTIMQGSFVYLPSDPVTHAPSPGYNYILSTQLTTDLTDKWNAGVSIPLIYKYYNDPYQSGSDVSNGGLGDISALLTRRLGRINATSVTALVGFPTGTYAATYKTDPLTPDKQLGFGRVTGTLIVDHTLDQNWGLIVLGAAGGYRGGMNSSHNYRAPVGSLYGYAGYFLGPLVPALGVTLTGFTKQDTRGAFSETLHAPVASAALNASIEWSTDWIAILVGASVPYGVRGDNWSKSAAPDYTWQPWTVSVGVSVSPF